MAKTPFAHEPVAGAKFDCEFADALRLTGVLYECENMIGIEILRSNGQIIAYPITTSTARDLAGELNRWADRIAEMDNPSGAAGVPLNPKLS